MNPSVPPPPSAAPPDPAGTPIAADAAHVESLRPVAYLELKAAMLLLFTLALIVGSGLYLLYARGAFEPTQTLVLTADDSEGVVVGMDVTFSGFPIGRVRRIELAETGNARIVVDVAQKDAHWLRESSVFTLVRGVVGGTNIRAYSGILTDPPLPAGAVRPVLRGDATAEIPQLMASARELLGNLNALTAQDAALGSSLANVQALTQRLNGPGGALGAYRARGVTDHPYRAAIHQGLLFRRRRRRGVYPVRHLLHLNANVGYRCGNYHTIRPGRAGDHPLRGNLACIGVGGAR